MQLAKRRLYQSHAHRRSLARVRDRISNLFEATVAQIANLFAIRSRLGMSTQDLFFDTRELAVAFAEQFYNRHNRCAHGVRASLQFLVSSCLFVSFLSSIIISNTHFYFIFSSTRQ